MHRQEARDDVLLFDSQIITCICAVHIAYSMMDEQLPGISHGACFMSWPRGQLLASLSLNWFLVHVQKACKRVCAYCAFYLVFVHVRVRSWGRTCCTRAVRNAAMCHSGDCIVQITWCELTLSCVCSGVPRNMYARCTRASRRQPDYHRGKSQGAHLYLCTLIYIYIYIYIYICTHAAVMSHMQISVHAFVCIQVLAL
jgi:hypothetical protein